MSNKAIDKIYSRIITFALSKDFVSIDKEIASIIERLTTVIDIDVAIMFLTATQAYRSKLKNRIKLYHKAQQLIQRFSLPLDLLKGLR